MRFGFVTCVQLGRACIEEVLRIGGSFDLLISLHDELAIDKSGRVRLDDLAITHDIELVKVRNINDDDAVAAIEAASLDLLFIIGWSQIAGERVLHSTRRGVIGMHPTLLPIGRGRASIPWAILKDLPKTGVTMFQLDEGVDTGPILAQEIVPLKTDETATSLYEKVTRAHVTLMRRTWPQLMRNEVSPRPQDERLATVWAGRRPEDGAFTFSEETTHHIDRLVRALTHPYPGAFTYHEGRIMRIWKGEPAHHHDAARDDVFETRDGHYRVLEYDFESVAVAAQEGTLE